MGLERGKAKLSRKAVLEEAFGSKNEEAKTTAAPAASMPAEEVSVIAQALEGLEE